MRGLGLMAMAMAMGPGCGGESGGTDGGLTGSGGMGGGVPSGTVSCTVTNTTGGANLKICQEATGLPAASVEMLRQQCMLNVNMPDGGLTGGAQFANAPCSRVGALGGCQITAGGMTITNWYYDDGSGLLTPTNVMTICAGLGTFIPA